MRYKLGGLYLEGLIFGILRYFVFAGGLLFYHVKIHRVLYLSTRPGAHNQKRAISSNSLQINRQNRRLEDSISDALIAFTSFRFLSYYGCPRIRNGASIFAEKVLQNDAKNNLTCENAVA